jgi:8-oxo-dGTP pyrophosphatase MutT (NUDIX family)
LSESLGSRNGDEAEPAAERNNGASEREPTVPVPKPASTVALVRDGRTGPETLLLLRPNSGFAAGAWVFPGGTVDPNDCRHAQGVSEALRGWARRMEIDDPLEAHGYIVAAIRETWEETGLLLGRTPAPPDELLATRRRIITEGLDFATAARAVDFELDPDSLVYFARWITPPTMPRRYDTRFFLADVAPDAEPALIGEELIDAAWITPEDALRRCETRELSMLFPTVHTLRRITGSQSARELVERLGRDPVDSFRPGASRQAIDGRRGSDRSMPI